ncbi:MAG: hypothetical protein KJZ74_04710 [Gemmatimonadales bacterium]|nr:hypothetical protein [Gemmatimonadales bacterium]
MTAPLRVRPPGRRLRVRLLLAAIAVVLLAELIARATGSLQRQVGLDTRPRAEVLAEQSRLITERLADPGGVIVTDSDLGWRNNPGYADSAHAINGAGARSRREYTARPAPGVLRVAAYGDAYVYAAEVTTEEAWSTRIEQDDATIEVLNFGVGGFGTDQAFLRYLNDGASFAPAVVVIGFAPVDLRRAVTRYTRFFSTDEPPLTKPRFRLDSAGTLRLLPNPVRGEQEWRRIVDDPTAVLALGADDAWYDPLRYELPVLHHSAAVRLVVAATLKVWRKFLWTDRLVDGGTFRPGAEAFRVQRAILAAFSDSARARGATALVVMLPDPHSVESARDGRRTVYAPLADSLTRDGQVEVLDLAPAFVAHLATAGGDGLFAPGGHFGPIGNRIIAERLRVRLDALRKSEQPDIGPSR